TGASLAQFSGVVLARIPRSVESHRVSRLKYDLPIVVFNLLGDEAESEPGQLHRKRAHPERRGFNVANLLEMRTPDFLGHIVFILAAHAELVDAVLDETTVVVEPECAHEIARRRQTEDK